MATPLKDKGWGDKNMPDPFIMRDHSLMDPMEFGGVGMFGVIDVPKPEYGPSDVGGKGHDKDIFGGGGNA